MRFAPEMEAMFASIEEEFRRGSPIESWHRVYRTYESLISASLAGAGERWPTVLVGSYPSFGDGGFTVEDLGSRNGTFVNGKPIEAATRLRRGDQVQFGETVAEALR